MLELQYVSKRKKTTRANDRGKETTAYPSSFMSETTSSMTICILAEGLLTVIVSRLDTSHELDSNQYAPFGATFPFS